MALVGTLLSVFRFRVRQLRLATLATVGVLVVRVIRGAVAK